MIYINVDPMNGWRLNSLGNLHFVKIIVNTKRGILAHMDTIGYLLLICKKVTYECVAILDTVSIFETENL